jgi:putative Mg2+ transporter-C (MgtC) family protein
MMDNDWLHAGIRLLLAAVLGGVIGLERQMRNKSAGVRTHMMVALGSALFAIVSIELPRREGAVDADPARIAAQIVTGVGFLGAGAILHSRGLIIGLTTAASVWVAAAIGMTAGAGLSTMAMIATGLGVIILVASHLLEKAPLRSDERVSRIQVRLVNEEAVRDLQRRVKNVGGEIVRSRLAPDDPSGVEVGLEVMLTTEEQVALLRSIREMSDIRDLRIEG